jgi:hypothetical protein
VSELPERAYFVLCLTMGRLLRSAKYATARIVSENGTLHVCKRRSAYAPFLVSLGRPLLTMLNTGVRILPQREWEQREQQIYQRLRGTPIRIDPGGVLVLPCLAGVTLSALLDDPEVEDSVRKRAIEHAVVALVELHRVGLTHGDAMAENVMVDLEAGVAHWFDFETTHDPSRPADWRRADDLRALLSSCLVRTAPEKLGEFLELILDVYGNEDVTRVLASAFTPVIQRPLTFHLAQAPLSFRRSQEITRLLTERIGK